MKLTRIDPLNVESWNDLIIEAPGHSFFHTANWARVLSEAYGYFPLYHAVLQENRLLALLPLMQINSPITRRRAVCLPFSDYCYPIMSENIISKNILHEVISEGKKLNWKYIEIRGEGLSPEGILPASAYYRHSLLLDGEEDRIYACFRENYRSKIRKAEGKGIKVKIDRSFDSVEEYYRLHCMTRKRHGLPPQPAYFFKKIGEHILSQNLGFIVLASIKSKIIAGGVFFHFSDQAIYKFGASDQHHQDLYANYLVMWKAIRWAIQNKCREFCFGRTDLNQNGLIQFKDGWGAVRNRLNYYRYNLKTEGFLQDQQTSNGRGFFLLQKMPIPVLKTVGNLLYRHIG